MIHFGIERLEYNVIFNNSCYYPIPFTQESKYAKILFGLSFGFWWWRNSISISIKPSENRLDKIDLFAVTYSRGFKNEAYAGSIDIEKNVIIRLTLDKENNVFRIQAFEPKTYFWIINFCTHYKYPKLNSGYTIKRTYGDKITFVRK